VRGKRIILLYFKSNIYVRCDQLKNKSSRRVTYGNPCYSIGSKVNSIYFLNDRSVLCRPQNFGRHCLSIQKKNCNPYFIVIMITVLIMNVIFWVVNFKTQNYFVISTTQNVYLRLSMYDCSNFVHSCRIFGISELQTV
jgi:hypothetical protein